MQIPERFPSENGLFHVTNRGVDRRDIVLDDHDREEWLRLLDRNATRCGWRVFAFALLDNHFHLYLRTPQANLSTGMRNFESGYATLFNRRHEREGHLFQSRFHAVIVENDGHSWELTRYVHLNSLRAGLTKDPFQDRWTSYRHYLNPDHAPAWLDWRTVLAEFGGTQSRARLAYKRFVEAGIAQAAAEPDHGGSGRLGSWAARNSWPNAGHGGEATETRETTVSLQQVVEAVTVALANGSCNDHPARTAR